MLSGAKCVDHVGRLTASVFPSTNRFSIGELRTHEAPGWSTIQHGMQPDGHLGAWWKCRRTDTLPSQRIRAAPFEAPLYLLTFGVLDNYLNPCVRIRKLKLLDGARECYHFVAIETGPRVMRDRWRNGNKQSCNRQGSQEATYKTSS